MNIQKYEKQYKKYLKLSKLLKIQKGGKPLTEMEKKELKTHLSILVDTVVLLFFEPHNPEVKNIASIYYKAKNEREIYLKRTGELYEISKDQINWTPIKWHELKKIFPDNMKFFYEMRAKIVDSIIEKIFEKYPECTITLTNEIQKTAVCEKKASGSDAATGANYLSDYDLTITGHFQVSKLIAIFNSVIISRFGSEPFNVFDTNLYGYSFMIPKNEKNPFPNQLTWPVDQLKGKYYYLRILDPSKSLKSYEQDVWAYKRLYTFLHETGNKYNISMDNVKINEECDDLHALTDSAKSSKYLEHMNKFENLMTNFVDSKSSPDHTNFTSTDRNGSPLTLTIEEIQNEMINALSNMNYYGDETYFTQGCFVHVVGTMFYYSNESMTENGKPKLLTIGQLIHSLTENLAYFLHAYDSKGLIVAIKYMHRFINAYHMIKIKKSQLVSKFLIDLEEYLEFIKLNIRNLSNIEIFNKLKNKPEYQEYFSHFGEDFSTHPQFNEFMRAFVHTIKDKLEIKISDFFITEGIYKIFDDHFVLYGMVTLIKNTISQNSENTDLYISYNSETNKYHIGINDITVEETNRILERKLSVSNATFHQ